MKKANKLYLVDENGEIVEEIPQGKTLTYLEEGDRVLRKDGIEGIDRLVAIKMRFAKVNPNVFYTICSKYPIFLKMLEYMQYQTGKIVFNNGVPINRKNLGKACGVSMATIDRQLKGLVRDDVIKAVKDGRKAVFFINPYIAHMGRKVNYSLSELFKNTEYKKKCTKVISGDVYD